MNTSVLHAAPGTTGQPHDPWRFSVAPMMDWTDRHCRAFMRLASRHARLYTEMVHTGAVIHGERSRILRFDKSEHPVALQLGGNDPDELARSAEIGERFGYDEINLNCGCPSDRVIDGRFGACLMRKPDLVAECVMMMSKATDLPVTVKNRIGIDNTEEYGFLRHFVETVAAAGCQTFIIHARKAWLNGLSPKENREIPPLRYEVVYRLKQEFPELTIVINGGIKTIGDCQEHLRHVDGVMLGREPYEHPWLLTEVDAALFGDAPVTFDRSELLRRYIPYIQRELAIGTPLAHITKHLMGLFRGEPGGRAFRRVLSERACKPGGGIEVIEEALAAVAQHPPQLVAA
ncbi:MAG: tRNA dihydrouridine(20/20a) synthase DusA [Nevskiaceae bacterium]|nr:MAG: tRNA dihydrouridine(20/20a) synthase DusA [Nevskiaceae bacterium]